MTKRKEYAISRRAEEGREVVDIFEDYDEAQRMLAEYRMSERTASYRCTAFRPANPPRLVREFLEE